MHELHDLNLSSIPISMNISNPPLLNTFSTIKPLENSLEMDASKNEVFRGIEQRMNQISERGSEDESFEFT